MRITETMIDAGVKAYAHWLTDKKALRRDMVQEIYKAMAKARWEHLEEMESWEEHGYFGDPDKFKI